MTETRPRIRRAAAHDFDAVSALLVHLGRPAVTDETRDVLRTVYSADVARAESLPLLAEIDGRPVGFVNLDFRHRLNRVAPEAWLHDLAVAPEARKRGVGRALLDACFDAARERRCSRVMLESANARAEAHRLFEAAGMTHNGKLFTIRLTPPHPGDFP